MMKSKYSAFRVCNQYHDGRGLVNGYCVKAQRTDTLNWVVFSVHKTKEDAYSYAAELAKLHGVTAYNEAGEGYNV